jgi:carbamoyl-phosphate synthase large subunit
MVTGVGSNIAQGIISGVRDHSDSHWILGTDINEYCSGYFLCDKGAQVPYARDPGFIEKITGLIVRNDIELVLLGVDAEVLPYATHKGEIEARTGCKIVVSEESVIHSLADKYLLHKFLQKIGVGTPETYLYDEWNSSVFPVIAKPRMGSSSRDILLLQSPRDTAYVQEHFNVQNYCFQEYIEGDEYTCGMLFDRKGNYSDSIIMKRRLEKGTSVEAHVMKDEDIQSALDTIGEHAKAIGPINVQLRKTGKEVKVFEINMRFSGTTEFRVLSGLNEVGSVIDNFLQGAPILQKEKKYLHFFRLWNTMVITQDRYEQVNIERIH